MQRFIDLLIAIFLLLVTAPVLLIIIVVLSVTGEREIFFCQDRVGLSGKTFRLYKFATMLKASPSIGTGTVTVKDDPRVLPVGKFLRQSKLNELPQLFNILIGDMSFIGPRPQTRRCFNAFPIKSKQAISQVRPGLSGIGSIVFRGEENLIQAAEDPESYYDSVIMPYKGKLEEWYILNQNFLTYFKLICITAVVVLRPDARIVWRLFPNLPQPPIQLSKVLMDDIETK